MAEDEAIQLGDRVINLQVPSIFEVVERRGRMLVLENDRGLRLTVHEGAVRRVSSTANGSS